LLGKTWIEKDQIRRKVEAEAREKKKKQELTYFIARKKDQLREEREDKSKQ
jgi:hypothetical protein